MKKIAIFGFFTTFLIPILLSQQWEHLSGGNFEKRVENNLELIENVYNLRSKGEIELMLLGDFNAPIEFFYDSHSSSVPSCFRILRDSSDISYMIEIKRIINFWDVYYILSDVKSIIYVPVNMISSFPKDIREQILDHGNNRYMYKKYFIELPDYFMVETRSYPVSDQFAEKLYKSMVLFIDNFRAKKTSLFAISGDAVKFRTVVDGELWSLWIHAPGGNVVKMSDLCRQIITDGLANEFDEEKYISVLSSFEN